MQLSKTDREYGSYTVLDETGTNVKVKKVTIEPGKSISMHRHVQRVEYWFVAQGVASIYSINKETGQRVLFAHYPQFEQVWIAKNEWHQLCNERNVPLVIYEIQYGEACVEGDIERQDKV